jgi:hypothetical protein
MKLSVDAFGGEEVLSPMYSHSSFGSSRTLKQMPQLSIMPRKAFCSAGV